MKIAVIGATGLVGSKIIDILIERNFPFKKMILVASKKSEGKKIKIKEVELTVVSIEDALIEKPDIALFSAGSDISKIWAPKFVNEGTYVIDNSSAWRLEKNVPLIVPEINAQLITAKNKLIANPNCSTIQLVMALFPLHRKYKIKRLVISTYQSVTGTGINALHQLMNERKGINSDRAYFHPIDQNCIPHCDIFLENSYTKEEMKLVFETRKILNDNDIRITATAVRVPVIGGHSESVNIEFFDDYSIQEIRKLLIKTKGVTVIDNVTNNEYPTPLIAHEKDDVFVGRIRRDESQKNTLNLWVVSDNLRKGAATNAVQIAENLLKNKYVLSA